MTLEIPTIEVRQLGIRPGLRVVTGIARDGTNRRELMCLFESGPRDIATAHRVNEKVARIDLMLEEGHFPRFLLISLSARLVIATMSGYGFNGQVELEVPQHCRSQEEYKEIIRRTKFEHVWGTEAAHRGHGTRTQTLKTQVISLDEAVNIYDAYVYTVPQLCRL